MSEPFVKRFKRTFVITEDDPRSVRSFKVPDDNYQSTVLQMWMNRGPWSVEPQKTRHSVFDFRRVAGPGKWQGNVLGYCQLDNKNPTILSNGGNIGRPELVSESAEFDWFPSGLTLVEYDYQAGGKWSLSFDKAIKMSGNVKDRTNELDVSDPWQIIFGAEGKGKRDAVPLGWEYGPCNIWVLKEGEAAGDPPERPADPGEPDESDDPPAESEWGPIDWQVGPHGETIARYKLNGKDVSVAFRSAEDFGPMTYL